MNKWSNHPIYRAIKVLPQNDRRKIALATVLQIIMGGLDLLGVIAVGLLGALSVSGLQSQKPGNRVESALEVLHIQNLPFESQAIILVIISVALLIGRTILSIIFTRRIIFFLSRRGAKISADLVSRLLSQPLLVVQARSTQETVYAVTSGVERIVLQVLATTVVWIADLALLFIMIIGLLVVDPITAVPTFLVFLLVAYFLYKFMHIRAGVLGRENSKLNILSNEKTVEVFASYRESVVRNRRYFYAREIGKLRHQLADTSAEINFLPYVSKYVIETTVVVGAVSIGAVQFILQDAAHAAATLAIFLAAGTRIAPAVLRLQQGSIYIKNGLGLAEPTLELIESLGDSEIIENTDDNVDLVHEGFRPELKVRDISITYPGNRKPAIENVTFTIEAGSSVAFVGPSGAGKTTMIDILLGVLSPDVGLVEISDLAPLDAVAKWPGAISYVPQDVVIADGTIRENVALGYPVENASEELIIEALKIAQLIDFVSSLPNGIDTYVGERGTMISGGQRQRLGIARAMFTRPLLLVLDEATSSLDAETEASISLAIQSLRGSTTVVLIAHRLSTVRNVDKVIYLSEGKTISMGTYDEVRQAVSNFHTQAKIMGL